MKKGTLYRWSGWLFVAPYLLFFLVFLVGPLLYGLRLSLFRWELLSEAPARFVGLANYQEAFGDPYFLKALGTTLRMVLFTVPCTVGLALLIAVGIDAVPEKRQSFYRVAFFLPGMLTISVVGILWRWFYSPDFGVFNAALAPIGLKPPWLSEPRWATASIVVMTLWWTVGGPMVTLLASLRGLPPQYDEAAEIDGATPWQRFWKVRLPQLRPVLLFVTVLNIIGAFQIFGQTFLVTKGGPEFATRTLVQYIYDTAFNNYRMGYASAMSWLLFLVISGFAVLQFRLIRDQ
jgi:multiple sugar transport system permease protein